MKLPFPSPNPLSRRLLGEIRRQRLLKPNERVLVAVSGGPDSVAMLFLLRDLIRGFPLDIVVAHIDHGMRADSPADARFVRRLARSLGMEYAQVRLAQARLRRAQPAGQEAAMRQMRYDALRRMAKRFKIRKCLVAHTLDDQAETVLMRCLWGKSLESLAAMAPVSRWKDLVVVRPLLEFRRQQLVAYLERRGISYRRDPTNRQIRFLRNRLRRQVMPYLKRHINPDLEQAMFRLSAQATRRRRDADSSLRSFLRQAGIPIHRLRPAHWNWMARAIGRTTAGHMVLPDGSRLVVGPGRWCILSRRSKRLAKTHSSC